MGHEAAPGAGGFSNTSHKAFWLRSSKLPGAGGVCPRALNFGVVWAGPNRNSSTLGQNSGKSAFEREAS